MAVPGVFMSDSGMTGNRTTDFTSALLQIDPNGTAPLLALSSGMQSEEIQSSVLSWFEEVKITGRTNTVSGGTGTSVVVGDGSSFIPGTLLWVEETGERLLVTAVAGNTLTVIRGLAGTAITAIDNTMNVTRIGVAFSEGSAMPTAVANQGFARTNHTQIFRNAWSVTGTVKAIKYITGDQVAKNRREAGIFHAEDIERSALWGKSDIRTLNGQPFRTMDGVITQVENYGGIVEAAPAGAISLKAYRDFLRRVFRYRIKGKPNERIAFCGDIFLQTLNEAAALDGEHKLETSATEFGLRLNTFVSPGGSVKLMTHPLMVENPVWQGDCYVLHPGAIMFSWLRRTTPEAYDTAGNRIGGVDADQGVITSELSVKNMASQTAGIFTGVTTPVASSAP